MAKRTLETAIGDAAGAFARQIIDAVKGATIEELVALQGGKAPQKSGPKPGAKRGRKPGRPPKATQAAVTQKRGTTNYPKCAYPSCGKNRFARGRGFCGDHWRQWLAGKIKDADNYQK